MFLGFFRLIPQRDSSLTLQRALHELRGGVELWKVGWIRPAREMGDCEQNGLCLTQNIQYDDYGVVMWAIEGSQRLLQQQGFVYEKRWWRTCKAPEKRTKAAVLLRMAFLSRRSLVIRKHLVASKFSGKQVSLPGQLLRSLDWELQGRIKID